MRQNLLQSVTVITKCDKKLFESVTGMLKNLRLIISWKMLVDLCGRFCLRIKIDFLNKQSYTPQGISKNILSGIYESTNILPNTIKKEF